MKVSRQQAPDQLACPSCGAMFADSAVEAYNPVKEAEPGGADDDVEVIRGGSPAPPNKGKGKDDLNLADELGELAPLPPAESTSASSLQAPAEKNIPAPRRAEYKMPQLMSNVGERGWSPGTTTEKEPLKFNKEKLSSTSDERLAAAPEDEEGSVQVHVARKIAEWDLDDDDKDPDQVPADG
ncbi:MAG: hypothetical protein ACR2RV_04055, partial [Verrucomicrobiales bacterium]